MTAKRPYIPLRVKLDAALLQLGLDPETAELHHAPPLALREVGKDGMVYPAPNNPGYLQWLAPADHKRRTFGPGGKKRITTAGSDIGNIAKAKRLAKKEVVRRTVLEFGDERYLLSFAKPKRRIPSRPFQKAKRAFQKRRKPNAPL